MAIAISVPSAAIFSTTDSFTYAFTSYTPTANALQVLLAFSSATVAAGTCSDSGNTLTWTRRGSVVSGTGSTLYAFTAQAPASPAASIITFDCTGDQGSGCGLHAFEVTGHDRLNPLRQALVTNSAATTNPTATLGSAILTTSGVIMGVGINRTAPAITPATGWTENGDGGWSTPNAGSEASYRAGGETLTTITTTGASGQWCSLLMEIAVDQSVAAWRQPISQPIISSDLRIC